MEQDLLKYIGRVVEIIYIGNNDEITQRRIEVRSVTGVVLKAYCLERKAPRVFRIENILAVQQTVRRTS